MFHEIENDGTDHGISNLTLLDQGTNRRYKNAVFAGCFRHQVLLRGCGCLRYLLLVMCAHLFAKDAFTLHLVRSEGHERYFGCNLMHRKVLALSHQHLMAEAPGTS